MDNETQEDWINHNKERDSFLDGLKRFHSSRGTHIRQLPTFGGKEVDLFLLYKRVTDRGGWVKVYDEEKWEEIARDFNLPAACANAGQALRYIYIRYMDLYEKVHFFGEDPDLKRVEVQEDLPGQRKKVSFAHEVPMSYNKYQHSLSDYMRSALNLPKQEEPSIYGKILQSLYSGLQNEVDFSVNICTLLSGEGQHALNLEQIPQLINLLLAHIGVFDLGPGSLKELHLESWKPASGYNFLRFWWESIEDSEVRQLICPEIDIEFEEENEDNPPMSRVLHLTRNDGMYDKEGQRVVQIAMILRNLSFEVENMKVLASNDVFLRFIILAAHCNYHSVRQLALDTLGNVGLQMPLSLLEPNIMFSVISLVKRCLLSLDKFEVVTGLEFLARICQVPSNSDVIEETINAEIYTRIVSYMTVYDIQLIAYTLECLYQLSELGEITSIQIARVSRAVSTLVSLVTVEAQSYGPESIKGIRVVEHVPSSAVIAAHQQQAMNSRVPAVPNVTPNRMAMPPPAHTPQQPQNQQLRRPIATATPPIRAAPTPPPPPSVATSVVDSNSFMNRWLVSAYEHDSDSQVNKMELYANYLNALTKTGQTRVPDMRDLMVCARMNFPKVEVVKIERDGSTQPIILLKGIRPRAQPLPFDATVDATMHLNTAQPGSRASTPQSQRPIMPRVQQQRPIPVIQQALSPHATQPTPPHSPKNPHSMLHQALTKSTEQNGATDNVHISPTLTPPPPPGTVQKTEPTLIKTLLAGKVQQNINRALEHNAPRDITHTPGSALQQQMAPTPGSNETNNHPSNRGVVTSTGMMSPTIPLTVAALSANTPHSAGTGSASEESNVTVSSLVRTDNCAAVEPMDTSNETTISNQCINDTQSNGLEEQKPSSKIMDSPDIVFNGATSNVSPNKEISPSKFTASIEEKKARMVKLMNDTKLIKEQLKSVNGVSTTNTVVLNSLDEKVNQSAMVSQNESQGKVALAKDNLHSSLNGFPETVNGNHVDKSKLDSVVIPSSDLAKTSDLQSDKSEDHSLRNEVLDSGNLNRNNNCNGHGDSPPPSPSNNTSGLPDYSVQETAISDSNPVAQPPLSSVQNIPSTNTPQVSSSPPSLTSTATTQAFIQNPQPSRNHIGGASVAVSVPTTSAVVLNSGQISQPVQAPGPITTPKVIMSAVSQSTIPPISATQPVASNVSQHNAQQMTVQVPLQLQQQFANTQLQPQMVQILGQQQQVVIPNSQAPNQLLSQVDETSQQVVSAQSSVVQPIITNQLVQSVQHPISACSQVQYISQSNTNPVVSMSTHVQVPTLIQQSVVTPVMQNALHANMGQVSNPQNIIMTPQGMFTSQSVAFSTQNQMIVQQAQVLAQAVTHAQIVTPQGQVIQQALPSHLVQQFIQAQLMQQQQQQQQQQLITVVSQPSQILISQPAGTILMSQGQMLVQAPVQASVTPQFQMGQVVPQQVVIQQPQILQQGQIVASIQQSVISSQVTTQPAPASQEIFVATSTISGQNATIVNQSVARPSPSSQYPLMQQFLHSCNPSIVTPPPASPQSSRSSPGPLPSPGGTSVKSVGSKRPPSRQSDAGSEKPAKKRRSQSKEQPSKQGSSVAGTASPATTPVPPPMALNHYLCEWASCNKYFETCKLLQKHVIQVHLLSLDGLCQWQNCDSLRRQRFSLITHIQDKHLNEASLRAALLLRQQQAQQPNAPPQAPGPPAVYPKDAAVQAIRRFAIKPPYPELIEMKEGPVTKHIRLTSALILRNLARYSELGRREIRKHEEKLAYVALSPVESSAAISSCLAELSCK